MKYTTYSRTWLFGVKTNISSNEIRELFEHLINWLSIDSAHLEHVGDLVNIQLISYKSRQQINCDVWQIRSQLCTLVNFDCILCNLQTCNAIFGHFLFFHKWCFITLMLYHNSVHFNSIQFLYIPFHFTRFNSIALNSKPSRFTILFRSIQFK